MVTRSLCALGLAVCVSLTATVVPAGEAPQGERVDELRGRFAEIRDRLALTDEQREAAAPIIRSSMERQLVILGQFGIDPTARGERPQIGLGEARELRKALDVVRADTLEALAEVLSAEQVEEYRSIQQEGQREMRRRLRANR